MERKEDATICCIIVSYRHGANTELCGLSPQRFCLGLKDTYFFLFLLAHVVEPCLQFLFFSAAQGLIRLISLPVAKADEDLDLAYVSEICGTAVCH